MDPAGYHEMKKFPKENNAQFNQKIHAQDGLESARVPFDQDSQKRLQVQRRLLYR
jgi:hypothetical protein